jgi:exodeoxyribonuclease VII large subunit
MRPAGQGTLFEDFLKLKAKLEQEGLFDPARKRALPVMPRGIGVVTSLGAAALHDVVIALQRRVPHIPVVLAPASVQGDNAPRELVQALRALYALAADGSESDGVHIDVIVLVRGGGSMEDLWSFNNEDLARTIVQSPVPVVCGVGHETDFTIADFVADLRAPTPTAAAELVSESRQAWLGATDLLEDRLTASVTRFVDRQAQRLDLTATRMGRPSNVANRRQVELLESEQRMRSALRGAMQGHLARCTQTQSDLVLGVRQCAQLERERSERASLRLGLLDPSLVLKRGYAWLTVADGHPVSSVAQVEIGAKVQATLVDGVVGLTVDRIRAN